MIFSSKEVAGNPTVVGRGLSFPLRLICLYLKSSKNVSGFYKEKENYFLFNTPTSLQLKK